MAVFPVPMTLARPYQAQLLEAPVINLPGNLKNNGLRLWSVQSMSLHLSEHKQTEGSHRERNVT